MHRNRVGPKGEFGKGLLGLLKPSPIRAWIKWARNGVRKRHMLTAEISFNTGGRFKLDLRCHKRPAMSEICFRTTELEVIDIYNKHQIQFRMPKHALPIWALLKANRSQGLFAVLLPETTSIGMSIEGKDQSHD